MKNQTYPQYYILKKNCTGSHVYFIRSSANNFETRTPDPSTISDPSFQLVGETTPTLGWCKKSQEGFFSIIDYYRL